MKTKTILFFLLACLLSYAQPSYEIQPGSKQNIIEMSISNNLGSEINSVNVTVQEKPEWINFIDNQINIDNIPKQDKRTLQFKFDVSGNAEPNSEGRVKFKIASKEGKSWYKIYNFIVTAPKIFKVQQNYPNPFNPSTTIKYSIPQDAFVSIKIFNVLGEKITELANSNLKAGLHEVVFNAPKISSGFYFYLVEAKGIDGKNFFDTKKMILVK